MVNDDKPLIKITENGVFIYGTPWDGKHHLSRNIKLQLKAICILERDESNHIEKIPMMEMFIKSLQQMHLPKEKEEVEKILGLIEKMLKQVGCYKLGCNMDPEAAIVSYNGMN